MVGLTQMRRSLRECPDKIQNEVAGTGKNQPGSNWRDPS